MSDLACNIIRETCYSCAQLPKLKKYFILCFYAKLKIDQFFAF